MDARPPSLASEGTYPARDRRRRREPTYHDPSEMIFILVGSVCLTFLVFSLVRLWAML